MKFQRRDGDMMENSGTQEASAEKGQVQKSEKKEYSVMGYVVALFCVVILLVMLSYFIQERRNSETISDLTNQHTEFTTQALQNIEELQNYNIKLTQELDEAKVQIEKLQDELDEAEEDKKDAVKTAQNVLKAEYDELLLKYQALEYMIIAEKACDEGNIGTAMEYYNLLKPLEEKLSAEWTDEYETLKNNLGVD